MGFKVTEGGGRTCLYLHSSTPPPIFFPSLYVPHSLYIQPYLDPRPTASILWEGNCMINTCTSFPDDSIIALARQDYHTSNSIDVCTNGPPIKVSGAEWESELSSHYRPGRLRGDKWFCCQRLMNQQKCAEEVFTDYCVRRWMECSQSPGAWSDWIPNVDHLTCDK